MHTRQTYRTSLSNLTVNLSILYLLCGNMVGYDTVRTQISQKIENVPNIFNMKRITQGHLSPSFCFCNLVSFLSFFFFFMIVFMGFFIRSCRIIGLKKLILHTSCCKILFPPIQRQKKLMRSFGCFTKEISFILFNKQSINILYFYKVHFYSYFTYNG